jgi:hypothetical protein
MLARVLGMRRRRVFKDGLVIILPPLASVYSRGPVSFDCVPIKLGGFHLDSTHATRPERVIYGHPVTENVVSLDTVSLSKA